MHWFGGKAKIHTWHLGKPETAVEAAAEEEVTRLLCCCRLKTPAFDDRVTLEAAMSTTHSLC